VSLSTTAIHEALVTLLTGSTAAGSSVYRAKTTDWGDGATVGIAVYVLRSTEAHNGSAHWRRIDSIGIDAVVQGGFAAGAVGDEAIVDDLDTLEGQILTAIDTADPPLGLSETDGYLLEFGGRTINRGSSSDGKKRHGSVSIEFDLSYDVQRLPTASVDLTDVHLNVDLIDPGDGPDGEYEATLQISDLDA